MVGDHIRIPCAEDLFFFFFFFFFFFLQNDYQQRDLKKNEKNPKRELVLQTIVKDITK